MMALKRCLVLFAFLTLVAAACNIPYGPGVPQFSKPEVVPSLVAQTMEALRQQSYTATPTASPPPTATDTPTNTPVPPTLIVSATSNCYAGPSSTYSLVTKINPGTTVTVVGLDAADNYWIIAVPGSPDTFCWLSGQYAQLSGDTSNLSSPSTPVPSRYTLSEPRNLRLSCSSKIDPDGHSVDWTVVFRWTNTEPNQLGVRVFRNNRQVATTGPHGNSFVDFFIRRGHSVIEYGVQAYNATAISSIVTIDLRHCD